MMMPQPNLTLLYKNPSIIQRLDLTTTQQAIHDKICNYTNFFFDAKKPMPFKVRGFLLEGLPQTGKTEICRQVAKTLAEEYRYLKFAYVDAATIASPAFGDSEHILTEIFDPPSSELLSTHRVIILDDLDCLFFGRDSKVSQSWHISLSSVIFHCPDSLDPRMVLFLGTSNRSDLVDSALLSRLVRIEVPMPTINELTENINTILDVFNISAKRHDAIFKAVVDSVIEGTTGFRDIQHLVMDELTHD
jgi:SpoVK/Ycf46/Vps4 family AAA+-type ATPase